MERDCMKKLLAWKSDKYRKPLVLNGARQVGKTWIMREFGKNYYEDMAYFNFEENSALFPMFQKTKDPKRLIEFLTMIHGKAIIAGKTLIVFDEIQECPEALNALKYFRENANEYHIITAGSLLGASLAAPKSYPVGQVDIMDIYPLSFREFIRAVDEGCFKFYETITKNMDIPEHFHNRLTEMYRLYLIIGGMPECVAAWSQNRDPSMVKKIQQNILSLYENDFSKHNRKINAARILLVYRSIVPQLAKENKKFSYGTVKPGARAREFEEAIEWLVSSRIVNRIYNVSAPLYSLKIYEETNHFKLYFLDTGLLKTMAEIENDAIILDKDFSFKGVINENFVLQQFISSLEFKPHYYAPDSQHEIDFLIQQDMKIIPIEVKSGKTKKATSFKKFLEKYNPPFAIRYSERNYKKDGVFTNIPLYLAGRTDIWE
ncbi:MAG: ATP-binding protein [Selenomonadaceae bacterium]|nr:ATP-binding protein [Selenomonadaceae bacterium]